MSPAGSQRAIAAGANWYVAPNGVPGNDGSITRPIDLATALSSSSPARPGDTIWLRGGVYRGNFISVLTGTATQPIVVRQYPGERATLDGVPSPTATVLQVKGAHTWYWGFEVMNSHPNRASGASSRGAGVAQFGAYTRLINLVVHDALDGIETWAGVTDGEVYGNVIYNNGAEGGDRGHGHSMYLQNSTGVKRIVDNVMLNSYSFGIHAYTEGGTIDNMHFEGNIAFNHGMLSAVSGAKANYLIGGAQVAHNTTWLENYGYYPMGSQGRNGDIGYGTPCTNLTMQDNYFAGGTSVKVNCSNASVVGNWFYGAVDAGVKAAFPNNTYSTTSPGGVQVIVRPNAYERGRANLAIYNWSGQGSVQVDLSRTGLAAGERYEIRDAQNFYGAAVASGTYSAGTPATVPMTGLTPAQPIGTTLRPAPAGPTFGAFIVLPVSGTSTTPAPTATLTVSPTSIASGQSATLSWSTTNATSVSISPQIGAVAASGSIAISPAQTTTYTLTASGAGGTVTRTATLTVTTPTPPTAPTATLTVSPSSIASGQSATLSWSTTNATSVSISPQIGAVAANGSIGVSPALTTTYTLTASGAGGTVTRTAALTVTVPAPPPPAPGGGGTATFVSSDTTTQGSWKSKYGADGLRIAADTTGDPGYAKVTFANALPWTWESSTTDPRALLRASGIGRVAATWYSNSAFTIDIAITDGQAHNVALYMLDWDSLGRVQTVDMLDAGNGALLDRRSVSGFQNGLYMVWRISGSVRVKLSGSNAVVSGLFFGPGSTSTTPAPTASISAAPASITAGQSSQLSWSTTYATSVSISPSVGSNGLNGSVSVSPAQTTTYTLTATGAGGTVTRSATVTVTGSTPAPTGGSATFVKTDTTTRGSWINTYGVDGFRTMGDVTKDPSYARVTLGAPTWTWASGTTDVRAVQRAGGVGRIAACVYNLIVTIDVDVLDSAQHQLALYLLDWDVLGRSQTVEILDRATGAVLDRRPMSAFHGGVYLVWRVGGSVRIKITRTGGPNAVVSGLFFDR